MNNLSYRNATKSDLGTIVDIYNSTVASRMVTADTAPVSVESREKWIEEHDSTYRPLWIVEDDLRKVIGWVSFQSFYGRPAYQATVEISIYLAETARGKGFGKSILSYCLNIAPTFGVRTLLAYIFAHNEPSIKLFRQFVFEEWAFLPNIAMMDGQEYGLKILGKRIG